MALRFKTTHEDFELIGRIADRAVAMEREHVPPRHRRTRLAIVMDISATHASGNPLDLAKLLGADDFNFAHDVFGIARHLDRRSGELLDCFVPRCSQPERQQAA